jgi:hypothetical protein
MLLVELGLLAHYMYMEHNMKIIEKIIDISTGEETIIEREETSVEKKERLKSEAENKAAAEQKEIIFAQRKAIAERLGLTADELQVLLG